MSDSCEDCLDTGILYPEGAPPHPCPYCKQGDISHSNTKNRTKMTTKTHMSELYVFKLWDKIDQHIVRQTKRGKKFDRAITRLACRELHFAIKFHTRLLTNA